MSIPTRTLIATIGAAVIVVAAVIVIVVIGFVPIPQYPSIVEASDPPLGLVAYSVAAENEHEAGFDERCIHVVDISTGTASQVICRDGLGWALGWSEDGRVATEDHHRGVDGPGGDVPLLLIEPEQDGVVESVRSSGDPRFLWPDQRVRRDDGTRVATANDGRRVVIRSADGRDRVIVEPDEAPSNYHFVDPQWSPDGRFVLVADTEGRLLVVTTGEEPRAYALVETATEGHEIVAAWYIEGNDTYTMGIDDLAPD